MLVDREMEEAKKMPGYADRYKNMNIRDIVKRTREESAANAGTPQKKRARSSRDQTQIAYITAAMDQAEKFETPQPPGYEEQPPHAISFERTTESDKLMSLMDLTPQPTDPSIIGPRAEEILARSDTDPDDATDRKKLYRMMQGHRPYAYHNKTKKIYRVHGMLGPYDLSGITRPALRSGDQLNQESWYGPGKRSCPFCPSSPHLFHAYSDFPLLTSYPTLPDLLFHVNQYHYPFINHFTCDACQRHYPTATSYQNHYQAELRREQSEGGTSKHSKIVQSSAVEPPFVIRNTQNTLYIPPLIPTRKMPVLTDLKKNTIQYGPCLFRAVIFEDHPLNPSIYSTLSQPYNCPIMPADIPISPILISLYSRALKGQSRPRHGRAPIVRVPALRGYAPQSAGLDQYFAPAAKSARDVAVKDETPPATPSIPDFATPRAVPTTPSVVPQPTSQFKIPEKPQPPRVYRSCSEVSATESISIPDTEDWDSEIQENPHPPTVLGRQLPSATSTPTRRVVYGPTPPAPHLPALPARAPTPVPEQDELQLHAFGMSTVRTAETPATKVNNAYDKAYYRQPPQFITPQLRNGASDVNDTGYSPLKLEDTPNTAQMILTCARPLRDRTMPSMSPLPSKELTRSDLVKDVTSSLNARSHHLQGLLSHNTNMSQTYAPCDNYAVQARDTIMQSIRSSAAAMEFVRANIMESFDATARQYELQAAAAIANRGPDSETIADLRRQLRETEVKISDLNRRLQEAASNATRLRHDRDTLNKEIATVRQDARKVAADLRAARADPFATTPRHAQIRLLIDHLDSAYSDETMIRVRPLLDETDRLLRVERLNESST